MDQETVLSSTPHTPGTVNTSPSSNQTTLKENLSDGNGNLGSKRNRTSTSISSRDRSATPSSPNSPNSPSSSGFPQRETSPQTSPKRNSPLPDSVHDDSSSSASSDSNTGQAARGSRPRGPRVTQREGLLRDSEPLNTRLFESERNLTSLRSAANSRRGFSQGEFE